MFRYLVSIPLLLLPYGSYCFSSTPTTSGPEITVSSTSSTPPKEKSKPNILPVTGTLLQLFQQDEERTIPYLRLPLKDQSSDLKKTYQLLTNAFEGMVNSTEFFVLAPRLPSFVTNDETKRMLGSAVIPLFGDDVILTFEVESSTNECIVSLSGDDLSVDDFGWVAAKIYEMKSLFANSGLDTFGLRKIVAKHFNRQFPKPGYDAKTTQNLELTTQIFGNNQTQILDDLATNGYVILDDVYPASRESHTMLSKLLVEKTCQGSHVRTDTVAFISRDDAISCELKTQFDLLKAMASFLNNNYKFETTIYNPLPPATREKPLTNTLVVQAAEYKEGDFYVEHSDNSFDIHPVRNNFRHITCIHYLNEDWLDEDGGMLRLYLNSTKMLTPVEAKEQCEFVDINPTNGRLLIFDSRLYHSVQKVKSASKSRLALTLWIMRPEDSGVRGEIWDEGQT